MEILKYSTSTGVNVCSYIPALLNCNPSRAPLVSFCRVKHNSKPGYSKRERGLLHLFSPSGHDWEHHDCWWTGYHCSCLIWADSSGQQAHLSHFVFLYLGWINLCRFKGKLSPELPQKSDHSHSRCSNFPNTAVTNNIDYGCVQSSCACSRALLMFMLAHWHGSFCH